MAHSRALHTAVAAAIREACEKAILPHYRSLSPDQIMDKGGNDPVTIADRESEALLSERLAALLPEAAIVGEEAVHADPALLNRLGDALCWIIDPIDGTRNYAAGKPPFGVLIALAQAGETIAGWLYDPLKDRLCHASRGDGAFIGDERIVARGSGASLPIAAISLVFAEDEERARLIADVAPHYRLVDIPYCAEEQYPRLALGENDVSFFSRTLPWDHAAGALWLNEAGGKVARLDGREYRPDQWPEKGMIGASTPQLWDAFAHRMAGGG